MHLYRPWLPLAPLFSGHHAEGFCPAEPEVTMRSPVRRLSAIALSALVAAAALLPAGAGPAEAASGDKRPNLQMIRLHDWHVQTVNGRRLLRFTSIFVNAGPGAFEVRGRRSSTSDPTMSVKQVMYRWDGTTRLINTGAVGKYAADGHDHWHMQGVTVYEAWKEADPTATRRGAKTGFCFLDSEPWNLSIRGARSSSYYRESWCGTRASLTSRMGLSVGWADNYPWWFAYQWIDITGLPGGIYRVRVTVDIQDYYDEKVETDNCVWTKVRIPEPGSTRAPTVYANGSDCGVDAITPVSSFANGVTWSPGKAVSMAAGTHVGYRFNSQGTVLRTTRATLSANRIVTASARAIPPGQSGRYLYMVSGRLAGWWVRQGDDVTLMQ